MNAPLVTAQKVDVLCSGCGECCRSNGLIPPLLLDEESPEWLSTLVGNLRKHFKTIAAEYPCVFLTPDNRCAIHEMERPAVCREFTCSPPCTRCGDCCREAHACDLRGWIVKDRHAARFEGICDQLVENDDGTTSCKVIESAIANEPEWEEKTRLWIVNTFVGRGCEKQHKEDLA
jgi:hypothetical protein